jgi:hypothetical protein
MIRPYRPLVMLVVCRALVGVAMAEDTTIWLETLLDRAPDDLSEPKDTKISVNAAHTFANDYVVGGMFETERRRAACGATTSRVRSAMTSS